MPAAGTGPAVVVLHGAGGPWGKGVGMYADLIRGHGFHACTVDYMDRTGHRHARDYSLILTHFPAWAEAVEHLLDLLASKPEVDGIALVGVSLGGALALAVGARHEDVRAVVEFSGPFPEKMLRGVDHMPPVLALHGDADAVVPVAEARRLITFLDSIGAKHELKIYPGEGHRLGPLASLDAARRVTEFLAPLASPRK